MIDRSTGSRPDPVAAADVIIVGGGPAGSSLAGLLALQGIDVVVLDRAQFPRAKPCGECINPGGVSALARLGLLDVVEKCHPVRLAGWDLFTDSGARASGRFAGGTEHGLGVSRAALDHALLQAARDRGARVYERTKLVGLSVSPARAASHRTVVEAVDHDGRRTAWTARLLVGADGLRSIVARQLGLVRRQPRLRKVSLTCRLRGTGPSRNGGALLFGRIGTVGLAPVHADEPLWNGTVVVLAQAHGRKLASDPVGFFRNAFLQAPFEWDIGPDIVGGPWSSGPFDWPTRRAIADGALLVGDASGYFDPLTGQGLYRAFRSAELAAPIIVRAVRSARSRSADLSEYDRGLRSMLRQPRALQRIIEVVVSRPTLRHLAVTGLQAVQPLANRFVRVVGDAMPVPALVIPETACSLLRVTR